MDATIAQILLFIIGPPIIVIGTAIVWILYIWPFVGGAICAANDFVIFPCTVLFRVVLGICIYILMPMGMSILYHRGACAGAPKKESIAV